MLQALLVNPADKPYVRHNVDRKPWAMVKPADECSHAGYSLIFSMDTGTQAKKLKKEAKDMWAA